jgi:signal recognition particle receptor subunit beta
MGSFDRAAGEIHAKVVYYGPPGVGLTSNIEFVHRKLRREHRGELKRLETAGAPHEFLPVELGQIKDIRTSIEVFTVPSGEAQRERRRELLTDVDGIVFVADLRPARHEATVAALQELRELLESHQRSLEDVTLVVQYNRRDLADENALDRLHRQLDVRSLATFEAVASEGAGVLQTLTSLAKLVLNRLRTAQRKPAPVAASTERVAATEPAEPLAPAPPPPAEPLEAPAPAAGIDLFAAQGPLEGAEEDPFAAREPDTGSLDLFAAQGPESFEEPQTGAEEPWVTAQDSQEFSGPLVAEPAQPLDEPPTRFRLIGAGPCEATDGELHIPIRLQEEPSGRKGSP